MPEILRLAAASPRDLVRRLRSPTPDGPEADLPVRVAVANPTASRLALAAGIVARGVPWRGGQDVWFTPDPLLGTGSLVFMFPGLDANDRPVLDEVSAEFGLPRVVADRTGTVGGHTVDVLRTGWLLDKALRRLGVTPDVVVGHSCGEWSALFSAGLAAPEAFDGFVRRMGPDAFPLPGVVFAAIGTGAAAAEHLVDADPDVVVSHHNSPCQTVICGPDPSVRRCLDRLDATVPRKVLPFRSGFHTPMLRPYLPPITAILDGLPLRPPAGALWSAITAAPYPTGERAIRALLHRHLVERVRFRETVERLYANGARAFVQVGRGSLTTFVADTLDGRDHLAVSAGSSPPELHRAVAALWVDGLTPDPPSDPVVREFAALLREMELATRAVVGLWERR